MIRLVLLLAMLSPISVNDQRVAPVASVVLDGNTYGNTPIAPTAGRHRTFWCAPLNGPGNGPKPCQPFPAAPLPRTQHA